MSPKFSEVRTTITSFGSSNNSLEKLKLQNHHRLGMFIPTHQLKWTESFCIFSEMFPQKSSLSAGISLHRKPLIRNSSIPSMYSKTSLKQHPPKGRRDLTPKTIRPMSSNQRRSAANVMDTTRGTILCSSKLALQSIFGVRTQSPSLVVLIKSHSEPMKRKSKVNFGTYNRVLMRSCVSQVACPRYHYSRYQSKLRRSQSTREG